MNPESAGIPRTTSEVSQWLKSIKCDDYVEAFSSAGIDGEKLLKLSEADLRDGLGVSDQIHLQFLLSEIQELQNLQAKVTLELEALGDDKEEVQYEYYQIAQSTTVLDSEYMDSRLVAELPPGSIVLGGEVRNTRLNLVEPLTGWISLTDRSTGAAIAEKIITKTSSLFRTTEIMTPLLLHPENGANVVVELRESTMVVVLEVWNLWFKVRAPKVFDEKWICKEGWMQMFRNGKPQLRVARSIALSRSSIKQPKAMELSDRWFGVSTALRNHIRLGIGCSAVALLLMSVGLGVPYWFSIEVENDLASGFKEFNRHWGLWQVCEYSEDMQIKTCVDLEEDRDTRFTDDEEVYQKIDIVRGFGVVSVTVSSISWLMIMWPKRYGDLNVFTLLGSLTAILAWGIWGASSGGNDESGAIWGRSNSWCNATATMACEDMPDSCDLTNDHLAFTMCTASTGWGYGVFIFGTILLLLNFVFVLSCAPRGQPKESKFRMNDIRATAQRLGYEQMQD